MYHRCGGCKHSRLGHSRGICLGSLGNQTGLQLSLPKTRVIILSVWIYYFLYFDSTQNQANNRITKQSSKQLSETQTVFNNKLQQITHIISIHLITAQHKKYNI